MLTYSLTTHAADIQPCKGCSLCMELLSYHKEGAAVSGKHPQRWSCTLLFLLQTGILSLGNTHWLFADTAPFIIYGRLSRRGLWMLSFYSCRYARPRTSARNIKPRRRSLVCWQRWVLTHFSLSPALSSFSVGADAVGPMLHCCVDK